MIGWEVWLVGAEYIPYDSEHLACHCHLNLHFVLAPDNRLVAVEIVVERILGSCRTPRAFNHGLPKELVTMYYPAWLGS